MQLSKSYQHVPTVCTSMQENTKYAFITKSIFISVDLSVHKSRNIGIHYIRDEKRNKSSIF